jgi:GTP-binding protein
MIIKESTFIKSSVEMKLLPPADLPEFAFIGRSNVGKSSLINMLVGKKELAKTSGNPGKTQTINHFIINKNWYLVDLPGYGFARVSQEQRKKWEKMINTYLQKRENLINVFVLIDIRVPPQESDIGFINNLGKAGIPISIVFTKADKVNKTDSEHNTTAFNNVILESWTELPSSFITSAEKKTGRDEILNYIEASIKQSNFSIK